MTKYLSLLTLGLVLTTSVFGTNAADPVHLFFSFQDGDSGQIFLKATKGIEQSGQVLLVHKDFSVDSLQKVLIYYQVCIDVTMNNIENENTTRTEAGSPFRRQVVQITPEGKVSVGQSENPDPRLIYDPNHPDSIESGPKKGYVEYPNINAEAELEKLRYFVSAYNSLVKLGESLDINFVAAKIAFGDYIALLELKELKIQNMISKTRMNIEFAK